MSDSDAIRITANAKEFYNVPNILFIALRFGFNEDHFQHGIEEDDDVKHYLIISGEDECETYSTLVVTTGDDCED